MTQRAQIVIRSIGVDLEQPDPELELPLEIGDIDVASGAGHHSRRDLDLGRRPTDLGTPVRQDAQLVLQALGVRDAAPDVGVLD